MTRRKSVCLKWTLVLLVVVFCSSVYTRPQEISITTVNSDLSEKSTEAPIRYRYKHSNLSTFKIAPKVISFVNQSKLINDISNSSRLNPRYNETSNNILSELKDILLPTSNRTGRRIYSNTNISNKKYKTNRVKIKPEDISSAEVKKSPIRKVITKWRDKTKLDDIHFPYKVTETSHNNKDYTNIDNLSSTAETSTENSDEIYSKRYPTPLNTYHYNMFNKPVSQYSEETQVYSTNMQVVGNHNRPTQFPHFHTNIPSPTPIITNVGYPQPWSPTTRKTTTTRPNYVTNPTKYEYHNNVNNNYGVNNYDATTFEPNSYTEKIVIRPQEYSPSAEDCPTIYLTLNNTFQGEGKEACPDLNIAVNTNVINKNVVVESEEDTDSFFPGGFGLGLGDDSEADSSKDEDYLASDENQEEEGDASVEGTELANYQSGNNVKKPETNVPGSYGAANSPSSALTLPNRKPGNSNDDIFSFSSLVDFFRPAMTALGWLASINPLNIGLFPMFLAPIGFLFASSGIAALFAPWFLPYAREAPQVIHVYRPEWHWDDDLKTWYLHSFPNNRRVVAEFGRASKDTNFKNNTRPTLFSILKTWMINITNNLKKRQNTISFGRKQKRKKRNILMKRVKFNKSYH